MDIALNCPERFLNIHVPAFSDETLDQIVRTGKKVMLSIHSTLCNLQTEEGMLERVFCLGKNYENETKEIVELIEYFQEKWYY